MKKIATITLSLALLGMISPVLSHADKTKKHEPTEEQKTLRKELLEKYDTNKDGHLDKEEKAKMSAEDKEKAKKAGLGAHKKEATETPEKKSDSK